MTESDDHYTTPTLVMVRCMSDRYVFNRTSRFIATVTTSALMYTVGVNGYHSGVQTAIAYPIPDPSPVNSSPVNSSPVNSFPVSPFPGNPSSGHSSVSNESLPFDPVIRYPILQTGQSRPDAADRLPRRVANRVIRDLASRTGIPMNQLSITHYNRETWQDSCLGLGGIAELCAQMVVPGWEIEVTDGTQNWIYRTDEQGDTIRLNDDESNTSTLPQSVGDRILEAASEDADRPIDQLQIMQAQERTWNGCLGIDTGGACTMIALPGWQVIVAGETGSWVYHSTSDATDIRLNETASNPDSPVVPTFIPENDLPPYPGDSVVFRAIVQGGIAGSTNEIVLLADGQVVQFTDDRGVSTSMELNRISVAEVAEFQERLRDQRFGNLNGLDYPAIGNSADSFTITLTGQGSTTRYADIVYDQLPSALQEIIQAWNTITTGEVSR